MSFFYQIFCFRIWNLINNIIPNIKETAELIDEIAAASNEQDTGIGKIE